MKGTETQRWVEAAIILAKDPSAQVACPRCEGEHLLVEDVRNPTDPNELERIMRCSHCGAMNALRMRRQPPA